MDEPNKPKPLDYAKPSQRKGTRVPPAFLAMLAVYGAVIAYLGLDAFIVWLAHRATAPRDDLKAAIVFLSIGGVAIFLAVRWARFRDDVEP
jgi:hypothetical protein